MRCAAARIISSTWAPTLVAEHANRPRRFDATDDFARLAEADAIIVCVPTPLGTHLEPDLSYVEQTADDIAKTLRPGSSSCSNRRPIRARPREIMLPAVRGARPEVRRAISSSPIRPSAKTPAARISTRRRSPSWSAASIAASRRDRRRAVPQGDQAGDPGFAAPRSPRRPSCWRTSTAR